MRMSGFAGACVLALVAGLAACDSAWAGIQKVAATNDAAPGYTGGTFMQMFGSPWLNEAGQVGFFGDVMAGGMPGGGLFLYDSSGGRALVRNSDTAPGGGTFMLGSMTGYAMNDAGQIIFGADVMGGASGLFRADGTGITGLIRNGDPAPGTGGGTVGMIGTMTQPALNALGQSALAVQVMGGSASSAVYRVDGLSLTPVAVQGQVAPGTGGATFSNLSSMNGPVLGNSGNVAFTAALMGPPAGHASGLFIYDDGTLALLAQEGNAAPGTGGAIYGAFGMMPSNTIVMAGHDKVAACVGLMGGTPGLMQGIFLWTGGAASPVALQQQAAPEGNGVFDTLFAPVINNAGQVAFKAALTASVNPPQDGEGLYRATGSTLVNIARKNNTSPDGNGKFSGFSTPVLAGTGQVAFEADLTMTAGMGIDDHGVFISDGIDIVKVARKGDVLPGTSSVATNVRLTTAMWPDVSSDVVNNFGQVAFRAEWMPLAGSAAGIFLFTPELLWRSVASGTWDTSANWTLGLTPAYVHPVNINLATSLTVTGPAGAVTVDSLRVAAYGGGAAVLDLAAGGSLNVNKDITVDGGGTLRLINGSLQTTGQLSLNTGGTYDGAGGTLDAGNIWQNGGTVTGTLRNAHQFFYNNGIFVGRLVNQGWFSFNNNSNFIAGNGMENDAQFYLFDGQTLTLNGAGLDNQGTFTFQGGVLTGNGTLTNNGRMGSRSDEYGNSLPIHIAGTGGFVNNAFFDNSGNNFGADVFLTNTGSNVNYGVMDIEGGTLHLDGGAALTNHGVLSLEEDAVVAGAGALTNASDGTLGAVDSAGIISTPFSNAGAVVISKGVLRIQQAFTNSGTIDLAGDVALLQGGAINNTGELQGSGFITNAVSNSGVIEPMGGTLLLSGAFVNNSDGRVNAATGTKFRVTSASSPNAGIISLEGGTVEFTQSLTNAVGGLISGRGTLSVGGAGLVNNGNVGFSGGFADVYGDVVNNAGAAIITSGGGTTTFYDDVNAAGGEMRVSPGCSIVFFGSYSGGSIDGGTVYSEGDLRPGHSPAAVSFEGTLSLSSSATTYIELGGTTPGTEYDTISVGIQLVMGGTLNISLIDPFVPAHNNTFTILTYASKSGAFDAINGLNIGPRLNLVPTITATSMMLTAVQGGPGAWRYDDSGNASVSTNWTAALPNGVGDVATFGSIITATRTVNVDVPTILGGMVFDNASNYAVAGPSAITLQNTGLTHATVAVSQSGAGAGHNVSADVTLASPLDVSVADGAAITFSGTIGNTGSMAINKSGGGTLVLSGENTYGGGTTVSQGTLLISNVSDTGSGTGAVTVGAATLGGTGFISGPVTLTGDSTLTSTGTLTINNTLTVQNLANQLAAGTVNTSGDVTIESGAVFIINGTLGGGTGDLIVRGTLMGKGTINKPCVIEAGGVLSPGSPSTIQSMAQVRVGAAAQNFSFEVGAAGPNYASPSNSANDLLRLTDEAAPFADASGGAPAQLSPGTVIDVYFVSSDPALGEYKAQFFAATDFTDALAPATFQYWRLDPHGSRLYNGNFYSPLDASLVDWSVVPETATFSGAETRGYITEFTVVPEPATLALLAAGATALCRRKQPRFCAAGLRTRRVSVA